MVHLISFSHFTKAAVSLLKLVHFNVICQIALKVLEMELTSDERYGTDWLEFRSLELSIIFGQRWQRDEEKDLLRIASIRDFPVQG